MLSDLLDVLGLAAFVAGVFVLAGLGWCLVAVCAALMFTARAVDDQAANRAVVRVANRSRARARRLVTAPARVAARARHRGKPRAA